MQPTNTSISLVSTCYYRLMPGDKLAVEIARVNLDTLTEPIEQVLARKAILQADLLSLDLNNPTLAGDKHIDYEIIRVYPTTAEIDWASPSGKLEILTGQTYLDFHILGFGNKITTATANSDYAKIAKLLQDRPEIELVLGVTYSTMAKLARRYQGFNIEKIELPDEVMNFASAVWQSLVPGKQFDSAHIVWQSRDDFITNPNFTSILN